MTSPTFTVRPDCARIFASTPFTGEGISILAGRQHLDQEVVLPDRRPLGRQPADDLPLGHPFPDVGQPKLKSHSGLGPPREIARHPS
jgi:hypothetical protein